MSKAQPVRVGPPASQTEPQPAASPPDPSPPDPPRAALNAALDKSAVGVPRELSDAERAKAFGDQVRARTHTATAKDGTPAPKRKASAGRLQLATSAFQTWDYITEHGTPFEALLEPGFWADIAGRFQPWSQIVVRCEDGSYYAELIVTEVGQLRVHAIPKPGYPFDLQVAEPDNTGSSIPNGYAVKWMGAYKLWGALRGEECIRDGFRNQAEAVTWLQNVGRAQR